VFAKYYRAILPALDILQAVRYETGSKALNLKLEPGYILLLFLRLPLIALDALLFLQTFKFLLLLDAQ